MSANVSSNIELNSPLAEARNRAGVMGNGLMQTTQLFYLTADSELFRFLRRLTNPRRCLAMVRKMTKATISSKGQIAIPKAVRDRLNLKAGTELVIDVQGEDLVMKRLVRDFPNWRTMRGMFRGSADELDERWRGVLPSRQAHRPAKGGRVSAAAAILACPRGGPRRERHHRGRWS